jgi:hypothetical protein
MNPAADFVADDRRLGRLFIAVGVFGLIVAVLVGFGGTVAVVKMTGSLQRSLATTASALEAVDGTVELAVSTLATMSGSLDTVAAVAEEAQEGLYGAAGIVDETGRLLTGDVPASLDAVLVALPAIERVAEVVDRTLRALSFLGVGYDPEAPFDEAVADLGAALDDLPDRLRAEEEPLADLVGVFRGFGDSSVRIAADLQTVRAQLDDATVLLDDWKATSAEAAAAVAGIRDALAAQRALLVGAVVVFAFLIAALQVVPLALGYRMVRFAIPAP